MGSANVVQDSGTNKEEFEADNKKAIINDDTFCISPYFTLEFII